MLINLLILISKIVENTLSTLRLIVVSNGKKKIGAILNGIISLCWIFSASIIIININKDIFNIISFCLGAVIGSYLGSILEEKIALGCELLICYSNKNLNNTISKINNNVLNIHKFNNTLLIYTKRKNIKRISKIIKSYDKKANILQIKANNRQM